MDPLVHSAVVQEVLCLQGVRRSSRGTDRPTCRDRSGNVGPHFCVEGLCSRECLACGPHGLVGCGQLGRNFHVVGDLLALHARTVKRIKLLESPCLWLCHVRRRQLWLC